MNFIRRLCCLVGGHKWIGYVRSKAGLTMSVGFKCAYCGKERAT